MKWFAPALAALFAYLAAGCLTERPKVTHASIDPPPAYHIHLPGIGGYRSIDRLMLRGLREGGFDAQIEPYDWTEEDPGLGALLAGHIVVRDRAHLALVDCVHQNTALA